MLSSASYNPDILTCLANLSNDEVFTPPSVANQMLDMLPQEIWQDENVTFLDPATKSGVFLREIAKRLIIGLERKFPDLRERLNHIYAKQLFGIAITELTALLSRRSVYCSKDANGAYSVASVFNDSAGNIRFVRGEHHWKNKRCASCGASQAVHDRGDGFENHAYEFIHSPKLEEIFDMKFDVIVGNPPYQLDTGGSGRQATPLYNKFVQQAKKLNPRFITMIIPSRWFAGGMGLDEFRREMLNDTKMREIVDFIDARDCFPGVDIAGGVCYFLWDNHHSGETTITNVVGGTQHRAKRKLNEFATFVRFSPSVPILKKVLGKKHESIVRLISATVPFGLKTSDRGTGRGDLKLISSAGVDLIERSDVKSGHEMIDKWKLITSKTSHDHGGQPDKEGKRRVLSRLEVHPPKTVCTGSYIVLGCFDTKQEAENLKVFASSKLFRFLVSLLSLSHDITRERFRYVPALDFSQVWTDAALNEYFQLNNDEQNTVSDLIKEM